MGSSDTVTSTTQAQELPLHERLPFPVARLQAPIVPEGTVVPDLLSLLSVEDVTKEIKVMEVQRMVMRPPTPGTKPETVEATSTAEATIEAPGASQPTQPTQSAPTQPTPTPQPTGSMDVSTLLGPDLSKLKDTKDGNGSTKNRTSLASNSNDSSSTLAPPTPASNQSDGNDSSDESDNDPADYADTDDEVEVPLPLFLVRDGQADDLLGTIADEDDLAWADVPPPSSLTELPALPGGADVPELLREIMASSLESVQAQLAVAVAEKAERDKVKASEAEAAAAARAEEKRRRQEQLEKERREAAALSKGKARDTATRHMPDPVDLRLPPPNPQNPAGLVKKSRRHLFASRVLRHVHVLGGSNERGESSAAGAAAAAEAAQAAAARAALQRAYEQAQLQRLEGVAGVTGVADGRSGQPAIARKPVKRLADKVTGPSTATRQQAYEQAMLRALEGGANSSTPTAATARTTTATTETTATTTSTTMTTTTTTTTTLPATAPIPTQRRAAMLLAMVRKDMEKKKPVVPATIECISCFEDVPRKEAVQTVCHAYCLDCFQQLVSTALANEAQFPPKCCLNEVPAATVNKYVRRDLARQYKAKADEFALPVGDRVYCPTVDCGVFVPPAHIAKAARVAHCSNGHETCTTCRQPAHGRGWANREACPEASAEDQRDQRLTDALAAEEGWRRCSRCAVLIEHREACQHMTCRCGAEFCFVCGLPWRTCGCGMDDLARMKRDVDARRVQRLAREAREEERVRQEAEQADAELAELRAALAQVAAFEQHEREKLQRIQRVQRARLQQLRQQREVALAAEVAAKYETLRTTLATLGALQTTQAQQARRQERVAHRTQQAQDAEDADARQTKRRAETAAVAATKIREAEQHWKQDYAARVALETKLEDGYRQLLVANAAWTGRDDHPQLVAAALRAYQRTNDARLDAYGVWRDRALAEARFLAEEEKGVRDEVQDTLRQKHTQAARKDRRALHRKHAGERVWCRAVAAERARLLAEMEVVEQGLGLAGSTSEADANLLLLLESGALTGENGDGDDTNTNPGAGTADDADLSHLYAVMLADIAGSVEDLGFGRNEEDAWVDENDSDHDNDHDSFYSLYAEENRNSGGSGSNNNRASGSGSGGSGSGGSRIRAEYNWPLVIEDVD